MQAITEFDIGDDIFYDWGNGVLSKGNIFEIRVTIKRPDGSYEICYVIEKYDEPTNEEGDVVEQERVAETEKALRVKLSELTIKKLERKRELIDEEINLYKRRKNYAK